jgi:peptidoglycan/LPS O-acetylase OafA/YrhL
MGISDKVPTAPGSKAGVPAARVPELDLLRFAAAVAVMFYHRARTDTTMFGFLGVQLFFMISGFVILWTAMNKSAGQFMASRVARLYPSFLVCLLLTAALLALAARPVGVLQLAANITMLPATFHQPLVDGVYWTLAVEWKFYLLVLLLLLCGQTPRIEQWLLFWLVIAVAGALPFSPAALRYLSLDGYAAFFIAGCYFYLVRVHGRSALRLGALSCSLVLAIVAAVRGQQHFTLHGQLWVSVCVAVLVVVEYAALYGVATRAWRLPELPLWYLLGSMTYPLYLLHHRAGNVFDDWLADALPEPLRRVVVILFVLLLSYVLARTVEQRLCSSVNRFLTARVLPRSWRVPRGEPAKASARVD